MKPSEETRRADPLELQDDYAWAHERVAKMAAMALVNAQVYGRKLLKGFGYPDETFGYAQDARALQILLATLEERTRERDEGREAFDLAYTGIEAALAETKEMHAAVGKNATRWMQRAEAAEATLTAAREALDGIAHYIEAVTRATGRVSVDNADYIRTVAQEALAALGSSPARLECDVCGFPEEGYPHPSGRCSKPDCAGTLRALGSSPAKEQTQREGDYHSGHGIQTARDAFPKDGGR